MPLLPENKQTDSKCGLKELTHFNMGGGGVNYFGRAQSPQLCRPPPGSDQAGLLGDPRQGLGPWAPGHWPTQHGKEGSEGGADGQP